MIFKILDKLTEADAVLLLEQLNQLDLGRALQLKASSGGGHTKPLIRIFSITECGGLLNLINMFNNNYMMDIT